MTKISIKISEHWKHLWTVLFITIALGCIYLSIYNKDGEFYIDVFLFFLLLISVNLMPVLILHINYYIVNSKDIFIYKNDGHFLFIHKGEKIDFVSDDIKSINKHQSYAFKRKDIQFLPWDSYHHTVIVLQNGTHLTITSLLAGINSNIPFPKDKEELKLNLFRWAPNHIITQ